MNGSRQRVGRTGEELAARQLERDGCRVIARNYRCPLGEMDLVVEGPEGLIFVEVRTKRRPCLVHPEETITRAKALRLLRLAEWYLAATGQEERPWRVDLMALELSAEGKLLSTQRFLDVTSSVAGDG